MDSPTPHLDQRQHAIAMPADRAAIRLYRMLESQSEAELQHVFSAIERLSVAPVAGEADVAPGTGPASENARRQRARQSLAAATLALGSTPSRRGYDAWRNGQPDKDNYAASTTI